jgi:protein SCO1/2
VNKAGIAILLAYLGMGLVFSSMLAHADEIGSEKNAIRWEQRQGERVPGDLVFENELGQEVRLADLLKGKPTILVMSYYECPGLCSLVMNGVVKTINELTEKSRLKAGQDYQVLSVSIDPAESSRLALAKQRSYLARLSLNPEVSGAVWHFLIGGKNQRSPEVLSQAVGFKYRYDASLHQYGHPSGIVVLDSSGKIIQYLMGIQYSQSALKSALDSANAGQSEGAVEDFILTCIHYNPLARAGTRVVVIGVQVLSGLFLVLASIGVVRLIRKETS